MGQTHHPYSIIIRSAFEKVKGSNLAANLHSYINEKLIVIFDKLYNGGRSNNLVYLYISFRDHSFAYFMAFSQRRMKYYRNNAATYRFFDRSKAEGN